MEPQALLIQNDGPKIAATNYWDLDVARQGKALVSANAGCFRLLLPPAFEPALPDMRTGIEVVVSRGPWPDMGLTDAFEIMFDDGSESPFCIHLVPAAFDRLPTDGNIAHEWTFAVWMRGPGGEPHLALERPCRYRRVPRLPWTRPREGK
jgi:hypothetical protein